jgi:arylsulfatase
MSDNGAEGQLLEAIPVLADATVDVIRKYYNSIDNIGNHNPFVWYGPQWALAATANRGAKSYTTDSAVQRGSGGMGGDLQVGCSKPRCDF